MKFKNEKKNFINIFNDKNKIINLKTPILKCPFGLELEYNKYLIKLELTNLDNNLEIKNFYETLIENINEVKNYIKDTNLLYSDNIRYSDKFDPLIKFYLPFRYDKFEVDFYKDGSLTTSKEIVKNCNLQFNFDIISIWKYKNKYGLNFKIKKIFIS
jgi:hypothetical protein